MSIGYFHLVLNHIPVLGVIFGILLYTVATIRKSTELSRISLWIFVLAAISAVPAFLTGDPAEDLVKGLPGVTEQVIEVHEEFASVALGGVVLLGGLALGGLIFADRSARNRKFFTVTVFICSLVSASLLIRTAQLGGQIRHSELRSSALGLPAAEYPRVDYDAGDDHHD